MGPASRGFARPSPCRIGGILFLTSRWGGAEQISGARPETRTLGSCRSSEEGKAAPEETGSGRGEVWDGAAPGARLWNGLAGSDPPRLNVPMNNLGICGCLAEGEGAEFYITAGGCGLRRALVADLVLLERERFPPNARRDVFPVLRGTGTLPRSCSGMEKSSLYRAAHPDSGGISPPRCQVPRPFPNRNERPEDEERGRGACGSWLRSELCLPVEIVRFGATSPALGGKDASPKVPPGSGGKPQGRCRSRLITAATFSCNKTRFLLSLGREGRNICRQPRKPSRAGSFAWRGRRSCFRTGFLKELLLS